MGYNQPRYGNQRYGSFYSGEDIKQIAYRHLTVAMVIATFVVLAINIVFYNDPGNPVLLGIYAIGSLVEIGIILLLIVSVLFRKQFSESTATTLLYVFAVASSIALAYMVDLINFAYVNGGFIITLTFGISTVVIFGMYAYTSANKPDVSGLSRMMFWVVIAFLVVSIIGFFIWSNTPLFWLAYSGFGALIFAVFIYIDFARLERREFSSPAMMALWLFYDIIFFIQYLLQFLTLLMGQRR